MKYNRFKKALSSALAACLIMALLPLASLAADAGCTVTFDGNGGTPAASVSTGTPSGTVLPDDPERQGFLFSGWNTETGGSGDAFTSKTSVTADTTVYAQWKENGYPVYYNANGGTPVMQKVSGNANGPVFPAAPTRGGYDFTGYNTKADGSGAAFTNNTPVTAPVTVYAQWDIREYAVTFSGAGGDGAYEAAAQGTINGTVFPVSTPIKDGFVFAGWSMTSGGSADFTPQTPVTAAITVYAVWDEDGYTVCFHGNGGSPAETTAAGTAEGVALPEDPSRYGYVFKGWHKDASGTRPYSAGDPVTSDMSLYAVWELTAYEVTFDGNGGTPAAATAKGSSKGTVLPQEPENGDLEFVGWNTKADGTGTAFTSSTPVTAAITVYAVWSPYYVKFDAEGAEMNVGFDFTFSTDSNYAYPSIYYEQTSAEGKAAVPAIFKNKPGYDFIEWNTKADGTGSEFTADTVVTGSTTVYAVWNKAEYTVEFNAGYGTFSNSEHTVTASGSVDGVAFPGDPVFGMKSFLYYYYSPDGAENIVFTEETPVTKNITVYAAYGGVPSSPGGSDWSTSHSQNGNTYTLTMESYTGGAADITMPSSYTYNGNDYTLGGNTVDTETYLLVYDDGALAGNTVIETVTLPTEYTEICDGMFAGCVNLQTVYLSDSAVTAIGAAAFSNCVSLESVALPSGVTEIGDSAFSYCVSLESINLTDSLEAIGSGAFQSCISLADTTTDSDTILPEYAVTIGDSAFIGSGLAGNLSLPCLLGLGSYAFAYCDRLTGVSFGSVSVNTGTGYDSFSADHAFYKCKNLVSVNLGSLTKLDQYLFACTGVTSVNIPDTLTSMGNYTFFDCDKITYVSFDDCAITGKYTFSDCDRLESINIGSGTATLWDGLFFSCDSLRSVYLPDGVTTLYSAFAKCFSLRSVILPDSLTDVMDYAFAYDYNLKSLYYPTASPPAADVGYLSISGYNFRLDSDEEDEASEIFKLYFPVTDYDNWDINAPHAYGDKKNYWFPVSDAALNNYNGTVTAVRLVLDGSTKRLIGGAPEPLAREGMAFLGWSTVEGDATAIFDFSTTPITSDLELYDCWEYTSYEIDFLNAYNSGLFASGGTDANENVELPATDPEREGFRFAGWNTAENGSGEFVTAATVFTADTSVYSIWTPAYFNVQFLSNGGSPFAVNQKGSLEGTTLPANITRTGYTLAGWKTAAGAAFTSATQVTEELTVYAQWTENSYTVTFNPNGGAPASSPAAGGPGGVSAPGSPALVNHTFTGWNTASDGGGIWYAAGLGIAEDTTFYAQWEKRRCIVYYNALDGMFGGGDSELSGEADYSSQISEPAPVPVNGGKVLTGWYADLHYTDKWNFDSDAVSDNMVLFAKWVNSSDIITITFDAQEGAVSPASMTAVNGEAFGSLPTPVRSGYDFGGWYTEANGGGMRYISASAAPEHDITLFAKWTAVSSGGGGTSSTTEHPAVKTTETGATSTVSVSVSGSANAAAGTVTALLTSSVVSALVDSAESAEAEGKKSVVEIRVEAGTGASAVALTIPKAGFDELAGSTDAGLKVDAGVGTVTFDAASLETISEADTSGDITITIEKVDAESLSGEAKAIAGDRPVYDFSVVSGGTAVSSFGGSVGIALPYALRDGEDPDAVVVFYMDDSGGLQTVRGAYDPETGTVSFKTDHFSEYVIGYNEVSFADVPTDAWYCDAVGFIAAREITSGTGDGNFSPDKALTRGQFIVMLMRAYGMEPVKSSTDNFADAGNTYYTDYLAAAKRLGITTGIGGNRFAPDNEISRQDMLTLLYRALDVLGELPEPSIAKTTSDFSDAGKISDYAKTAMGTFISAGIISGSGGRLNPTGSSTRAQAAQVLYNLLSA